VFPSFTLAFVCIVGKRTNSRRAERGMVYLTKSYITTDLRIRMIRDVIGSNTDGYH
jgi:hypothetical protein